jgi:hypothetical protein
MKKELLVGFRVDNPGKLDIRSFFKALTVSFCKSKVIIPLIVHDQVWIWFDFATIKEKKRYINWIVESKLSTDMLNKEREETVYAGDLFMQDEPWMSQENINFWLEQSKENKHLLVY